MNELIDTKPDILVEETEYKRLLGFPNHYKLEGRSRDLADWARQWYTQNCNPWVYALKVDDLNFSNNKLQINNTEFASKKLRKHLAEAQAHSAILAVVSAGKECEEKAQQLWQEGKPDEYFFLEVYGSAVVEYLITSTGFRFCEWAENNSMAILPHYSPGYPGWNVEDQNQLFKLIRQMNPDKLPGEIDVLETGMLKPKKSMLALFGITKHINKDQDLRELIPCQTCSFKVCQYRRVPYKYYRPQIEDVHQLQPDAEKQVSNRNGFNNLSLTENAKYSVSPRALQKWAQERLQLKILDDSSVEAKFQYEGTTCSNMGQSLKFDYQIKLSSAMEGYIINSLSCNPAPDDTGHKFMCEYIKDAELLMKAIKKEKPVLGKSLNDVLKWERKFSPEGCYCNSNSRKHKWGLALEVLHYTLVQYANQKIKMKEINIPELRL